MTRYTDIAVTALAPAIWGSTYLVTTEFLPQGYPFTAAALRALPAGLLLLLISRRLPSGLWWGRVWVLGALNFTVFWTLLFVAAYRLPGGVAATLGASQPLMVAALSAVVFAGRPSAAMILAALGGLAGVSLLVLGPVTTLDPLGVAAGIGGAASMAAGTVLTKKWHPPVPLLTFTAWQLTAGGLLLLPLALILEPPLPPLDVRNVCGFVYLGLIGAAATYLLWFRGIARLGPNSATLLGFLSPLTAVFLGFAALGQTLSPVQWAGALLILTSLGLGQIQPQPERKRT